MSDGCPLRTRVFRSSATFAAQLTDARPGSPLAGQDHFVRRRDQTRAVVRTRALAGGPPSTCGAAISPHASSGAPALDRVKRGCAKAMNSRNNSTCSIAARCGVERAVSGCSAALRAASLASASAKPSAAAKPSSAPDHQPTKRLHADRETVSVHPITSSNANNSSNRHGAVKPLRVLPTTLRERSLVDRFARLTDRRERPLTQPAHDPRRNRHDRPSLKPAGSPTFPVCLS